MFVRIRRHWPRLTMALMLLGMFALMFSGCETDTPQNTFDAKGEVAERQRDLFYIAMWPALVIMILVLLAIVVIALRFRERDPNFVPKQVHGNTRLEVAWTIAPAVLLLGLGVWTVVLIYDLDRPPDDDAYVIDIVGQRFQWEFLYPDEVGPDGEPLSVLTITDEPHIPTGKQVFFRMTSIDVIHSFWIPKLGGKRDVIPCLQKTPGPDESPTPRLSGIECLGGYSNELWLVADEPDTFHGQCAEYCGNAHALMDMTIHADTQADFDAWVSEMQADAAPGGRGTPTPTDVPTGQPGGTPADTSATPAPTVNPASPTPTPTVTPTATPAATASATVGG